MSEEDKLMQQELVDEIMEASEQFPNAILYMESLMKCYEELEKENQQYKQALLDIEELIEESVGIIYNPFTNQIMARDELTKSGIGEIYLIASKTLEGSVDND